MTLSSLQICSRWIEDLDMHVMRREHIVLCGNIHDRFIFDGKYLTTNKILFAYLRTYRCFDIVLRYDAVDGLTFADKEEGGAESVRMSAQFQQIVNTGMQQAGFEQAPTGSQDLKGRDAEAFAQFRDMLTQRELSCAAIVELGDMLTTDPSRYPLEERKSLVLLKKCTLQAKTANDGKLNTLVIVAGDLRRVPEWFYHDNPQVTIVNVDRPSREERKYFASQFIRPRSGDTKSGFYDGDKIAGHNSGTNQSYGQLSDLDQVIEEFADLTDGLHVIQMEAMRVASHTNKIAIRPKHVKRLVDFFKFGVKDDPWEAVNQARIATAKEFLEGQVIGQPEAISAVLAMLMNSRVGLSLTGTDSNKSPKGVFFFVGPTGVGKTELAKALTKLVFHDEAAYERFDMSEFSEEHAAEKLVGSPPGYIGYGEGGRLTNRVLQHPHSILLFDEIEKAHPRVLDKFLQILEDGRLTDGMGRTAYFNQTAIIFTSNIGSSNWTDGTTRELRPESFPDFESVKQHFTKAVRGFFTEKIGRVELLNRLGDGIVVFDLLRDQCIPLIVNKFLNLIADSARDKYQIAIEYAPSCNGFITNEMKKPENMILGGRRVKTLVNTLVRNKLSEWIFSNGLENFSAGRLIFGISTEGEAEICRGQAQVATNI